jgi:hypothetical protein
LQWWPFWIGHRWLFLKTSGLENNFFNAPAASGSHSILRSKSAQNHLFV